jgi:hypothetical protein
MDTVTIPPTTVAKAHDLLRRYPGMSAANRLRWARSDVERSRLWGDLEFDTNLTARIERDGFTVSVQYSYDQYPDISWMGHFTDDWVPGAIKHLPGWYPGYDGNDYTRPNPRTFGWFVPGNSAEAIREWYGKAGYARHDAWLHGQRQTREDYERVDRITMYDLQVTVFRADVELAVDYLGSIDLGDDLSNVDAAEQAVIMAIDSIENALAEAKTAMKAIAAEFVRDATIN